MSCGKFKEERERVRGRRREGEREGRRERERRDGEGEWDGREKSQQCGEECSQMEENACHCSTAESELTQPVS